MADSSTPVAADGKNPGAERPGRKTERRLPALAQQVAQTGVPVLQQGAGVIALDDDDVPVLEETFAEFEKTVPVLEQSASPSAPAPVESAVSQPSKTGE